MRTGIAYDDTPRPCPRRPPSSRSSGRPGSARRPWRSRWPTACARRARIPSPCRPTRCRSTAAWRRSPARPPTAEQERLEHRLLAFLPVDAPFSAGQYARLAHREIDDLLRQGRRPIVVGGTGLYLRAALAELDLRPPVPQEIRERWAAELDERGPQALHAELAQTGTRQPRRWRPRTRSGSSARSSCSTPATSRPPASSCGPPTPAIPTLLAGLTMEREALHGAIDARVDAMVAAGAREEVRQPRRRTPPPPSARRSASASCWPATSRR